MTYVGGQQHAQRTGCGHELAVAYVKVAQLAELCQTGKHPRITLSIWMCGWIAGAVV